MNRKRMNGIGLFAAIISIMLLQINISSACDMGPSPNVPSQTQMCGGYVRLSWVGTPPANTLWYWQDTVANGTSTAYPFSVYTVTTPGTYYLRSRGTNDCWWGSVSVTVTAVYPQTYPSAPGDLTVQYPACGTAQLTATGTPPANETWYWQTSCTGTSINNPYTGVRTVSTSATYYLRARHNNSTCWATGCKSIAVTIKTTPGTPAFIDAVTPACGSTALNTDPIPIPPVVWYWQGTDANGTRTDLGSVPDDYMATATGTYYLRAYNSSNPPACAWSVASRSKAVVINPLPAADAGADVTVISGNSTTIGSTPVTGNTYAWSPATGLDNPAIANPVATPTQTMNYTLTVTDANGCSNTDEVTVTIQPSANTCNDAILHVPTATCESNDYMITGTEMWFKFVADSSDYFIKILPPVNTPVADINELYLYSGDCSSLQIIGYSDLSDSLTIFTGDLTIGNTYYIKAGQPQATAGYFSLCVQTFTYIPVIMLCPPPPCDLISNGDFTVVSNFSNNGRGAFSFNEVCGWYNAWGTPDITSPPFLPPNYNARIGSGINITILTSEGLYNTVNVKKNDKYILSFYYHYNNNPLYPNNPPLFKFTAELTNYNNFFTTSPVAYPAQYVKPNVSSSPPFTSQVLWTLNNPPSNQLTWQKQEILFQADDNYNKLVFGNETNCNTPPCGTWFYIDLVSLYPVPPVNAGTDVTICEGNSTTLTATGGGTYNWSTNETTANIIVTPYTTSTFTVTVTDANGCTGTDDVVVTVTPLPDKPVIDNFINNNCDGNILTYTLLNPQSGVTYTWAAVHSTASVNIVPNISATSATVTITGLQEGDPPVVLTITADNNGCQSSATYYIFPCCEGGPDFIILNNYTINADITYNPTTTGGKALLINGNLIVNANVTFENNLTVNFGPDASITVMPYRTLTINNSHLFEKCFYMWKGIYATSDHAVINIFNNSVIRDAKNAVVSEKGGVLLLYNSTFQDNYKDVVIRPGKGGSYPVTTLCDIYGNKFIGVSTLKPQYPPVIKNRTLYAMDIDSAIVMIGKEQQNPNIFGKFSPTDLGMDIGIHAFNSQLILYNNTFQYIDVPPSGPIPFMSGIAVYALSRPVAFATSLAVGDNTFPGRSNTFNNCATGVWSTGINNTLSIKGNTFTYASIPNVSSVAIRINETYHPSLIKYIEENTIDNYNTGIRVDYANNAYIHKNTISHIPPPPVNSINTRRYGVLLNGCSNTEVYDNDISCALPPVIGNIDYRIEGVSANISPMSNIHCNNITNLGRAILCSGSMASSTVILNKMDNAIDGICLNNSGVIGQQGSNMWTSDNEWLGTFSHAHTYSINSNGTKSPFYIKNPQGTTYYPPNMKNFVSNGLPITIYPITPQLETSPCPISKKGAFDIEMAHKIINDEILYPVYTPESKWMGKQHLYRELVLNDTLVLDDTLQEFKTEGDNGTFGKMDSINERILAGEYSLAEQLNEAITDTIITENTFKAVNNIYINSLITCDTTDNLLLTEPDLTILRDIAIQCPFEYGKAVYMARVLLSFIDTVDYINDCEYAPLVDTTIYADYINSTISKAKVYPNPAKDELIVECDVQEGEFADIEIYNLLNQRVMNYKFDKPINYISIDKLNPGIYTYKIIKGSQVIDKSKLVIIK